MKTIKATSWHYKLQEYIYGEVFFRHSLCPYFHLTVFAILICPFVFSIRWVASKVNFGFNYLLSKIPTKTVLVTAEDWVAENLIDHYSAFRFYQASTSDDPDIYRNSKTPFGFYKVWGIYLNTENGLTYPFLKDQYYRPEDKALGELYDTWLKKAGEDLYEAYVLPAKLRRQLKREKQAKKEARFNAIAKYTVYPVRLAVVLMAAFFVAAVGWGLGTLAGFIYLNPIDMLYVLGAVFAGVFTVLSAIASLEDDDEFNRITPFFRVVLYVPRKVVRFTGKVLMERIYFPLIGYAMNIFEIFIDFAKAAYENACPIINIDIDNVEDNPRIKT